jgi:hypothetical protein
MMQKTLKDSQKCSKIISGPSDDSKVIKKTSNDQPSDSDDSNKIQKILINSQGCSKTLQGSSITSQTLENIQNHSTDSTSASKIFLDWNDDSNQSQKTTETLQSSSDESLSVDTESCKSFSTKNDLDELENLKKNQSGAFNAILALQTIHNRDLSVNKKSLIQQELKNLEFDSKTFQFDDENECEVKSEPADFVEVIYGDEISSCESSESRGSSEDSVNQETPQNIKIKLECADEETRGHSDRKIVQKSTKNITTNIQSLSEYLNEDQSVKIKDEYREDVDSDTGHSDESNLNDKINLYEISEEVALDQQNLKAHIIKKCSIKVKKIQRRLKYGENYIVCFEW